jgi:hypothetical protein
MDRAPHRQQCCGELYGFCNMPSCPQRSLPIRRASYKCSQSADKPLFLLDAPATDVAALANRYKWYCLYQVFDLDLVHVAVWVWLYMLVAGATVCAVCTSTYCKNHRYGHYWKIWKFCSFFYLLQSDTYWICTLSFHIDYLKFVQSVLDYFILPNYWQSW